MPRSSSLPVVLTTPILFCSHVLELGGAEMVLLDVLAELDRKRFTPHLAVPGNGPLASRAAKLGVPLHEIPLAGYSKLGKVRAIWRARRPLRRLAAELDCHVLVANSMIAGYAAVLAQQPGLACVWHLHAVLRSKIAHAALRRANQVIAPSQAALDAANLSNGTRIENGVPDAFFNAAKPNDAASGLRQQQRIPADAALFGIIGRLDPHKGHEVLLRSLALEWPNANGPHLAIAGGELFAESHARLGGFQDQMKALVTTLGLDDRVHWLGEVRDPATLLPQLDALVVPSSSLESSPRTIAEAQAARCPVIASDIGGIAEMLENGAAGLLVPPNDVQALGKALAQARDDQAWREQVVPKARQRAEQHYRVPAFVRRCEAVFAQANTAALASARG
ncbi:MAG: glycosyltransferase involved in cell wall biosynthesis [Planctomycetota bacterium]|jgi:glycosyltransferase involved in cell wall biosynthesis